MIILKPKKKMMSYNQKSVAKRAVKHWALFLIAGFFTLTSLAPGRIDFSGEWKLNESKTVDANFFCVYDRADRFWSKTMKISEGVRFLTINVANSFGKEVYKSEEKLTYDGKETEVNYGMIPDSIGFRRKKFTATRSGDGQTIMINSIVFMNINGEKIQVYVTEVWKSINAGNSISVEYNVKSTLTGDRYEKRVYDRVK